MTNPNSSETSSTDNNQPPTPPMQNNTKLVKEGILEEVPSTVGVGEELQSLFVRCIQMDAGCNQNPAMI